MARLEITIFRHVPNWEKGLNKEPAGEGARATRKPR